MADLETPQSPSLASKEWWGVSANATINVLILEVIKFQLPNGEFRTRIEINRERSTLTTTKAIFVRNDPNRVAFTIADQGNNNGFILPDADVSSSVGLQVVSNGGSITVEGNEIKVFGPAGARAAPGDRNPTNIVQVGNDTPGAAVQAPATNWTYTVPAGRKLDVELLGVRALSDNLVGLNANADSNIEYQPSGGANNAILQAQVLEGQASHLDAQFLPKCMTLYAGDVLRDRMASNNNAVGSNVDLYSYFKGTEYDA